MATGASDEDRRRENVSPPSPSSSSGGFVLVDRAETASSGSINTQTKQPHEKEYNMWGSNHDDVNMAPDERNDSRNDDDVRPILSDEQPHGPIRCPGPPEIIKNTVSSWPESPNTSPFEPIQNANAQHASSIWQSPLQEHSITDIRPNQASPHSTTSDYGHLASFTNPSGQIPSALFQTPQKPPEHISGYSPHALHGSFSGIRLGEPNQHMMQGDFNGNPSYRCPGGNIGWVQPQPPPGFQGPVQPIQTFPAAQGLPTSSSQPDMMQQMIELMKSQAERQKEQDEKQQELLKQIEELKQSKSQDQLQCLLGTTEKETDTICKTPTNSEKGGDVRSSDRCCTIKVTGLKSTTTQDTVKMFFASKKRTGAKAANVKYQKGDCVAYISYDNQTVLDTVLEKHAQKRFVLDNNTLDLIEVKANAPTENDEDSEMSFGGDATPMQLTYMIKAIGLDPKTTNDTVKMFFGSKKRTGAKASNVKYQKGDCVAYISYDNQTDLDTVMEKYTSKRFVLDKRTLQLINVTSDQESDAEDSDRSIEVDVEPKKPTHTIKVTGLKAETTRDTVDMFFENSKRTGAEAKNVEYEEGDCVAFISYDNQTDLDNVLRRHAQKALKLEGKTLELKEAKVEKEVEDDKDADYVNPYEVIIGGIDLEIMTQDAITMFLTWASGDNEIKQILQCTKERHILVQFKDIIDYGLMTRNISRRRLEDVLLQLQPVPITSTIQIRRLPGNVSQDMLQFYFEHPKSGGGDIKEDGIELHQDEDYALVTFCDHKVLNKVIPREHKLAGCTLSVRPYQPHIGVLEASNDIQSYNIPDITKYKHSKPTGADKTRTIEVRGSDLDEEKLSLFFSNKKHSGGDDTAEVQVKSPKIALITYDDHKVASRVLGKQLREVFQTQIEVSASPPRKISKMEKKLNNNCIGIKGIPTSAAKETVQLFVESMSQQSDPEIHYGYEPGRALVKFQEPIDDFEPLGNFTRKRKLENCVLSLEKIFESNAIQVYNVNERTTEDCLELYFSCPKWSRGGDVEKIDLKKTEQLAIVYFMDYKVVAQVTRKQTHTLNGSKMTVRVYHAFLGPVDKDFDTSTPHLKLPEPIVIAIDPMCETFLNKYNVHLNGLQTAIQQTHGKLRAVHQEQLEVECTLTRETKGAFPLCRTWTENMNKTIKNYLEAYKCESLTVLQDVFERMDKLVKEAVNDFKEIILVRRENTGYNVFGTKGNAEAAKNKLKSVENTIVAELERERSIICEKVKNLKSWETRFLLMNRFIATLKEKFKDLETKIELSKGQRDTIILKGVPQDCTDSKLHIYELLKTAVCRSSSFPPAILNLHQQDQCRKHVMECLKTKGLEAVWEVEGEELKVFGNSQKESDAAINFIGGLVVETKIQVDRKSSQLLTNNDWKQLVTSLSEKHKGLLEIIPKANNTDVAIVSLREFSKSVKDTLTKYLDDNTILTENILCKRGFITLLQKYHKDKINSIKQKNKSAKIELKSDTAQVLLTASRRECQSAKMEIQKLIDGLQEKQVPVDESGMPKYFCSEEGGKFLLELEEKHKCVIGIGGNGPSMGAGGHLAARETHVNARHNARHQRVFERNPQHVVESTSVDNDDLAEGFEISADADSDSLIVNGGIKITLVRGQIIDQKVDILVNSVDHSLDLSKGKVSASLLRVAGNELQKECKEKYPNGIKYGEIAATKAYNLQCKGVYHGPCKGYKDPECEKIISKLIQNALSRTATKQHSSIAFPALGSGNLGVPKPMVAKWMYREVMDFAKTDGEGSSIQNVTFVVYDKDMETIQAFEHELNRLREIATRMTKPEHNDALVLSEEDEDDDNFEHVSNEYDDLSSNEEEPENPMEDSDNDSDSSADDDDDDDDDSTGNDFMQGNSQDTIMLKSGLNITLVRGEIAKQNVDVIVNSTNPQMKLNQGAVSTSLLSAAGPGLQAECKNRFPNGITPGQVAETAAQGQLYCKEIYHGVCKEWNKGNADSEKSVRQLITGCLTAADAKGYTSIAFPALGTGNLGIPRDMAAYIMYDEVRDLTEANPISNIDTVNFVVYDQDYNTIQVFEDKQSELLGGHNSSPVYASTPRKQYKSKRQSPKGAKSHKAHKRRDGRLSRQTKTSRSEPKKHKHDSIFKDFKKIEGGHQMKIGDICLQVCEGDITKSTTDAIVNSTNDQLDLGRGAVSKAIVKSGGNVIKSDCERGKDQMSDGLLLTNSGKLPCKSIIHMAVSPDEKKWKKLVEKCLKKADETKFTSITFPALGTGALGQSPGAMASMMIEGIADFTINTQAQQITLVKIFVFQKEHGKPFWGVMQNMIGKPYSPNKGFFHNLGRGVKNIISATGDFFGLTSSASPTTHMEQPAKKQILIIDIYSDNIPSIDKAEDAIKECIRNKHITKDVTNEGIAQFNDDLMRDIKQFAASYAVDCSRRHDNIRLRGVKDDVGIVSEKITDILIKIANEAREKAEREKEMADAKTLAKTVQWCYTDVDGTDKKYDPITNRNIENAYNAKKKHFDYKRKNGTPSRITFDNGDMKDTEYRTNKKYSVNRTTPSDDKINLPKTWTDNKGKRMITVALTNGSAEYNKVSQIFMGSIGQRNINQILRIQHPTRYRQYMITKQEMEKKNGKTFQNERTLFHGTDANSIDNINSDGFNRSYCGKNATMYGQGVYFALSAQYSDGYARQGHNGKNMYIAKVLTGQSTVGNSGMIVPPKMPGGSDRYDSVTDGGPSMYVIFHDSQAYPEYLVNYR
ncbi:unnamed protein product [Owenia fusiformis]|uniref:Uncharacterized protein n=1 Tax=Owenia fusiformis TaxID=6347 RepID=A0A8J1XFW6_OWEFU|nr:unnamed protein product [Owenia fusiformis]